MSFLDSIRSFFYDSDKTLDLHSYENTIDHLRTWCLDLELPLNLNEDERAHTIALKIFDKEDQIYTIKDAIGKHTYKKQRNFEEFILDLDCIDTEGRGIKWVCFDRYGKNPISRKKEFFLMVESPLYSNQFYEKAHYLWEENIKLG